MKKMQMVLGGIAVILAIIFTLQAQETAVPVRPVFIQTPTPSSSDDLATMIEAVELTTPLAADSVSSDGTFYSAQHNQSSPEPWPPFPGDVNHLPAWNLGGDVWLLDDANVDYDEVRVVNGAAQAQKTRLSSGSGMQAMDVPGVPGGGSGSSGSGGFTPMISFATNSLWLQITNVSNGLAYLNLMNATDSVYEIYSTAALVNGSNNWSIAAEVWPTNPAVMPFTVLATNSTNLFIWARNWTGITSLGNTTPEWWFWKYFGTVDLSDTNLDSTGEQTLLFDYQHGHNPNIIQFSLQFTNTTFSTSVINGTINIVSGTPEYEAVLINDTNTADAVWQSFSSTNVAVNLPGNGTCGVEIGLKGLPPDAAPVWQTASLTCLNLNAIPLILSITNPTSSTVSVPIIQLQGLVSKALTTLTYDVSNATGVFTNQQGYWQPAYYDTNLLAFTTNSFQCYDIALAAGVNQITLHAMDTIGNMTNANFSYTLSYAGVTNPPALSLIWPQPNAAIGGTNFTMRVQVSDATATVTATINSTTVQGLVERSGLVWLQNLPLNSGTNTVTLTAISAAGNVNTTNYNVVESSVNLTIDPLPTNELSQASVTVTGTVGGSGESVWANGVAATVTGNSWSASGVPVSASGTALIMAQAGTATNNIVASATLDQVQPATVVVAAYEQAYRDVDTSYLSWDLDTGPMLTDNSKTYWASGNGLNYGEYQNWGGEADIPVYTGTFNNDLSGYTNNLPVAWEEGDSLVENATDMETFHTKTTLALQSAGQEPAGTTRTYLLLVNALEYRVASAIDVGHLLNQMYGSNNFHAFLNYATYTPLAPVQLQVNGQTPVNMGITNADGSVSGAMLVSAPSGASLPLTPTATLSSQNNAPVFQMQAMNFRLTVVSNSAVQINGTTNWVVVKSPTNDYVIVQAMVDNASDALLAGLTNVIQWTGGQAVAGNPLQRLVSKTNSVETTVNASIGSVTNSLNVWVIWANLTVKVSGTLDTDDKAADISGGYWPTELGGGSGLGPIDCQSTTLTYAYTIGKMEAKAILQPSGIGNLITNGWDMRRTKEVIAWDNGGNYNFGSWVTGPAISSPPPGTDDTSHGEWKFLNPINGDLFDLDGPGCSIDLSGTTVIHTAEVYDNFYEYVTLNFGNGNQVCSNTNTWSYTAQVDADATNHVQVNSVSTSLITLPTAPHYTNR